MSYTTTPNYGLIKPNVNSDNDQWGTHLNQDMDTLDAALKAVSNSAGVNSFNTRTGAVTLTAADVTTVLSGSATLPAMDGTAAAGTSPTWAHGDHVHPSDTSRLALAGGTMTGPIVLAADPAAPLQAATKQYADAVVGHNIGRNRLHNSGFSLNQRTYVSGTALAAAAYAHDRWKAGASGCTYTFTQNQPFTTITITAGSLQQIVETIAVEGGAYVLSWSGTAQGRVNAGTYAASPVTVTGLAANTAITVEFNAGTVGGVQLEPGSVATPLEKREPVLERALCQRFYQVGSFGLQGNASATATTIGANQPLPVVMRAIPTINYNESVAAGMAARSIPPIDAGTIRPTGTAANGFNWLGTFTASADL